MTKTGPCYIIVTANENSSGQDDRVAVGMGIPMGIPIPMGMGIRFSPVGIPMGIPIGIPMGYSNMVSLGHP